MKLSPESRSVWNSGGASESLEEKGMVLAARHIGLVKEIHINFSTDLGNEEEVQPILDLLKEENFIYSTTFRSRGSQLNVFRIEGIKFDRFGQFQAVFTIHNKSYLRLYGVEEAVNEIHPKLMRVFNPDSKKQSAKVSNVTIKKSFRSTTIETRPNNIKADRISHSSFYPWLKEFTPKDSKTPYTVNDFIDGYLSSNESVLINYGPPGTGKSTLTNHMVLKLMEMDDSWSVFLLTSPELMNEPELLTNWLMELDDRTMLIFEDLDMLLAPRSEGNTFMSTILNIADGLSSKNIKMVFNTNQLDLSNIDSALWRPGRCYSFIYFNYLDFTQVNTVRQELGIEPIEKKYMPVSRVPLAMAIKMTNDTAGSAQGLGLDKDRAKHYEEYTEFFGK